ncbi:Coatomer subunit epsilon, putative (Epsilon-cop coatomer subunit, putative), partial [Candida maltosa Xu316]
VQQPGDQHSGENGGGEHELSAWDKIRLANGLDVSDQSKSVSSSPPTSSAWDELRKNPEVKLNNSQQLKKMDAFSDSGELYTIRNQFYTNQHNKVKAYSLDSFSPENQLKVLEFQIRSTIALEQDASKLIDEGKAAFPENEPLFQLLSAWNDLKDFGVDDSTYFEDVKTATFELQAVLTALYLVKFDKDIDQAIYFLSDYIDNVNSLSKYNELEPFLVLVQLYLIKGNLSGASKVLQNLSHFPESARDSIIYQVMESWILAVTGGTENINNSYYFYDEILSNDFDEDKHKN